MSISITDTLISSDETPHTAQYVGAGRNPYWVVSWLPTRCLSRNQAITAMTIAETVGAGLAVLRATFIEGWARELDLESGAEAVRLVGGES